jgi:hypothetical protein
MRMRSKLALLAALVTGCGGVVALVSPATTAVAGSGTPVFQTYVSPSNLSGRTQSGEPSIGINWNSGAVMYQSGLSTYRVMFNDTATPATATWSDVTSAYTQWVNIDPILATDSVTGRTIAGGLEGPCSLLASSDNDGAGWLPVGNACTGSSDHETVGLGPWKGTPPIGSTYNRAVYYCAQLPVDACTRSIDGGRTFQQPVLVSGCSGLHGHVKISPDGTAYVPNRNCGGKIGGAISTNNGDSWSSYQINTTPNVTSTPSDGFDPSIAAGANNTLYQAWSRAGDYHPMVAKSVNHGGAWTSVTDLASTVSPALVASTFPAVVAGDDNRAAVAFLGTSTGSGNPFGNGYHGVWYLYVSYTYDGGATWSTVKASADPVQRGCIWDDGGTNVCRNILDFMDASVTKDGRVVVGYADGCVNACAGTSGTEAQSTTQIATIARQSTGQGLFAAYDGTPGAPTLSATPGNGQVALSWTTPSAGSSAITGYNVYRGTASGSETLLGSTGVVNAYTDTTAANGTTYYYKVAAVNATGTGQLSNEVTATPSSANVAPTACYSHTEAALTTSVNGTCSTDPEGPIASYSWAWGDSTTSSGSTASHTYAADGTYNVVLTVTDGNGATNSVSHPVFVSAAGDPDPTVPNLAPGVAANGTSGATYSWTYYKVYVAAGTTVLKVDLSSSPACYARCAPDLNVAVRQGVKPNAPDQTCPQSPAGASVEACNVAVPAAGWYYVGVQVVTSGPATPYTVTASIT